MDRVKSKAVDDRRLREAEGWLALGGAAEALAELSQISAANASSLEVLRARYTALAATEQWNCALVVSEVAVNIFPAHPEVWLWRAHAVRVLTRSAAEAHKALAPAGERFPCDTIVLLNLALYESELGRCREATLSLEKVRESATNDHSIQAVRDLVDQNVELRALWLNVEKAAANP